MTSSSHFDGVNFINLSSRILAKISSEIWRNLYETGAPVCQMLKCNTWSHQPPDSTNCIMWLQTITKFNRNISTPSRMTMKMKLLHHANLTIVEHIFNNNNNSKKKQFDIDLDLAKTHLHSIFLHNRAKVQDPVTAHSCTATQFCCVITTVTW